MNRQSLSRLLDVVIRPGNDIGDETYYEALNEAVGHKYDGEPYTAVNARQLILDAFDAGYFKDGDAIPSDNSNS